ncbi:carbohydrate kinase [Ruminococcaceae bacterium OttesenSCG-928-D13]|nr:carbohydrate kinase [Ruminococcaceae bacterium OttesenSCG-928-D13]
MKYDVVALGELLIDFTDYGKSMQDNPIFEANPGGAPGNVLAMLAKLDRKTAFIGKVGADMFGRLLIDALAQSGIDTTGVLIEEKASTTLAFVCNSLDGDREFSFFRKPGADTMLCQDDVDINLIKNCDIFHFGSLSLTHQPARCATQIAVEWAKKAHALISFDPNLRPLLWDTFEDAKHQISWGCSVCDILKIAVEELFFITGKESLKDGIRYLRQQYPHIKLILLTKGKQGAEGYWGQCHFAHPSFMEVKTIDTTGAGDTFLGCCLSTVLEKGIDSPSQEDLEEMVVFANAAASLITTKKGALLSMPEVQDIEGLLLKAL